MAAATVCTPTSQQCEAMLISLALDQFQLDSLPTNNVLNGVNVVELGWKYQGVALAFLLFMSCCQLLQTVKLKQKHQPCLICLLNKFLWHSHELGNLVNGLNFHWKLT